MAISNIAMHMKNPNERFRTLHEVFDFIIRLDKAVKEIYGDSMELDTYLKNIEDFNEIKTKKESDKSARMIHLQRCLDSSREQVEYFKNQIEELVLK